MQKFPRRWDNLTKINFLQRKIIINSILYYELNTSKISDKDFDEISKYLVGLHKEYSKSHSVEHDTQYGYVFYDFDGSTGFLLYHRLNEQDKEYLMKIAKLIVGAGISNTEKVYNKTKKGKGKLF